jgi:DNA-directed RNA polymerase specialized sigma24 family protein
MSQACHHLPRSIDWAILMRDHYPRACRVIKRLMPSKLQAVYDPEDFVGEAIVQLMAAPHRSTGAGAHALILIARRRMIDAARSPRSQMMRLEVDMIDPRPSAAQEHEAADLRERLVGKASDRAERTVIELRCLGHSLPEIADLTGLGVRTLQRFWKQFTLANEPY